MAENSSITVEGKRYDGFQMFDALEGVSYNVGALRLLCETILDFTDEDAMRYAKGHKSGGVCLPYQVGHNANVMAQMMLDYVCNIEKLLKAFDIDPE